MDKLRMSSPDLTASNIDKLAELFPSVITESLDAEGNPVRAVNFDLLRQELSDHIVEGPQERYQLDWPGKRAAAFAANAPIAKTLRPVREESVNFDTTKNLFIEGDNLEVLKLLQESYLGKVKLIYIDPPYNTGRDFVYRDDFSQSTAEYMERTGQIDLVGGRLVSNAESSGRFHSNWLSMIYPRIRLARTLLADEGIMVISIDDGELANLRKMCDEIFGEDNFIGQVIWKKRNTPPNDRAMGAQHDYLLFYGRNGLTGLRLRPRSATQIARYKNPDNHPKGPWVPGDLTANVKGGRYVASLHYPVVNPRTGHEYWPSNNGNWRFNSERMVQLVQDGEIYFGKDDLSAPKLKRFLVDVKEGVTWTTLWDFAPYNSEGSAEMHEIFGNSAIFESPKPVGLLKNVLLAATDPDSLVLDFFAGSASMAAAVMKQNSDDGYRRRFIMIQLPETTGVESIARREGYETISALGRERLRREGRVLFESGHESLDVGFRALRLANSNMSEVSRSPEDTVQAELMSLGSIVKVGRTGEDLLFQVLLDSALDLALPILVSEIHGHEVYNVDDGALLACFDNDVSVKLVRRVAEMRPLRAVFRDSGFATDDARVNAVQVFREISPGTEIKVI